MLFTCFWMLLHFLHPFSVLPCPCGMPSAEYRTTWPSGHLVCSIPITCKAMENLFESVMKEHGAWIRMEEYELMGDES